MEKKSNKSIIIGITSLVLMTLILVGLTYAYYRTRIIGNNSEDPSISVASKKLEVVYQNESAYIEATGIQPGFTATKTFEVKNTGDDTVYFSILLDNITNTFVRMSDWTYELKEGSNTLKSGKLPQTTSYITYKEEIAASATKNYSLIITYANLTTVDQYVDMGKSLSLRINIGDETGSVFTKANSNTLLAAIGKDNVISEPLTIPGREATSGALLTDGSLSNYTSVMPVNGEVYPGGNGDYTNDLWVYASGYEFDEETGLYSLTGVKYGKYSEIYNELPGKYLVDYEAMGNSSYLESYLNDIKTSDLRIIYKIENAVYNKGGNSYITYKTKRAIALEGESVLSFTEDDYATSYYFRGNVTNNFVNYSGMCWRIVRVQGNGTIKLALADESGECNDSQYSVNNRISAFVDERVDIAYIEDYQGEISDMVFETSDIPPILSDWASDRELDTSKLVEAEWCNDTARIEEESFGYDEDGEKIFDKDSAVDWYIGYKYAAYGRLNNRETAQPTLKCDTQGIDGSTSTIYENILGILSADEIAFAGSDSYANNRDEFLTKHNYLQSNAFGTYWTMTPYNFDGGLMEPEIGTHNVVYSGLDWSYGYDYEFKSVRPAVVLKSDVTISSGNGTQSNPYKIS